MPKITWDQSFSVGVPAMDEQHQKWIAIINLLHDDLMDTTYHPDSALQALEEMLLYALTHFAAEEKLLKKIGFPATTTHVAAHKRFQEKIETLINGIQNGQFVLDRAVMSLLNDWLTRHILDVDQQYAAHLAQSGPSR